MIDHDTPASTIRLPVAAPRHPLAHLARWFSPKLLIGLLVGVLAVEGSIRLLELRTGSLLIADRGIAALHEEQLNSTTNEFDLVAIGSSTTGADIWMDDLESSGIACDGYASWLPSTNIDEMAKFVSEQILPSQSPDRLVVGLTMREFVVTEDYRRNTAAETEESDAMRWATEHIALIRGRKTLQAPDRVGAALRNVLVERLHPNGNQLILRGNLITEETERHRLQESNWLAQYDFDPQVYSRLDDLLAAATEAGVHPIVVNLPVTDTFIEFAPQGEAAYASHVSAIRESADGVGATFIDLGNPAESGLVVDADFADVNHLNASGATKLTAALASRLEACRS